MIFSPKGYLAFKKLVKQLSTLVKQLPTFQNRKKKTKRYVKCTISYNRKKRANRTFFLHFLPKRINEFK